MSALTDELEIGDAPTGLYRLFDAGAALLYVGVSDGLRKRFSKHADVKPWWPDVARKTVQWYPTRPEALAAESAAILAENPLYNIQRPKAGKCVMPRRPVAACEPSRPRRATRPEGVMAALYDARVSLGLSLGDLSLRCGDLGTPVTDKMLGRLENGRTRYGVKAVPVLTKVLGIDVASLYCEFLYGSDFVERNKDSLVARVLRAA